MLSQRIDQKITLDIRNINMVIKTNFQGEIESVNNHFVKISGYKPREIIGKNEIVIHHIDMPKVIQRRIWIQLHSKYNTKAIVKNLAKNGKSYWTITDFNVKSNGVTKKLSFISKSVILPNGATSSIKDLYKKLKSIEQLMGIEVAEKYLIGFLEEKNTTYGEYIEEICLLEEKNAYDPKDLQYHKPRTIFS